MTLQDGRVDSPPPSRRTAARPAGRCLLPRRSRKIIAAMVWDEDHDFSSARIAQSRSSFIVGNRLAGRPGDGFVAARATPRFSTAWTVSRLCSTAPFCLTLRQPESARRLSLDQRPKPLRVESSRDVGGLRSARARAFTSRSLAGGCTYTGSASVAARLAGRGRPSRAAAGIGPETPAPAAGPWSAAGVLTPHRRCQMMHFGG
jgi:hypothetical protein